jgi:glycolate oxidase
MTIRGSCKSNPTGKGDMYKKIDDPTLKRIEGIAAGNVIRDPDLMEPYSRDECALSDLWHSPEVVVKPTNAQQIVELLKLTPRGSGTGLCGGAIPIYGGIVVSFEQMKRIVEVDPKNRIAIVEPGVSLAELAGPAQAEGLFFSPRPGDESASFGGIVATNAGGSRALGYGVTRDCTMGLEVALPPPYGKTMTLGGKTVKDSSGYSLLHLMIGSEGTLGVITRAMMRLDPLPSATSTLIVPYENLHDAIATVPALISTGTKPTALEFVEQDVITVAERKREMKSDFTGGQAYLMIEIDTATEDALDQSMEAMAEVCEAHHCVDVLLAAGQKQKEVWEFRGKLYEMIKEHVVEILDIVVPPPEIANHVDEIHRISDKYGVWLPTYGHAGDGNVHCHFMKVRFNGGSLEEMEEEAWRKIYPGVRDEIHQDGRARGGLVSGEHGIGLTKKKYLPLFYDATGIALMKRVKCQFDPNNILNPGKIFDEE